MQGKVHQITPHFAETLARIWAQHHGMECVGVEIITENSKNPASAGTGTGLLDGSSANIPSSL